MSDTKDHSYNTEKGWDERYSKFGASGSGTFVHSKQGNELFYRTKFNALDKCIRLAESTLEGASVLDAAGGSGKFIEYFLKRKSRKILVTDFSKVAVEQIQSKYKSEKVMAEVFDLTDKNSRWAEEFDFVFVMEAIFLLKTKMDLDQAIQNLSRALKPGGHLIISDLYPETEVTIGSYVIHRTLADYEKLLSKYSLTTVGFITQSVIFNRNTFGRFQNLMEQMGPLMIWIDRIAMKIYSKKSAQRTVKYLVAKRKS